MTPALSHLSDQPQDPLVRDPVLEKPSQPAVIKLAKKSRMSASSTQFTFFRVDPDRERIQRIMRAAPRPEPVGEAEEVHLVDRR